MQLPSKLRADLRHSADERQVLLDRTKVLQERLIKLVAGERERRETGRERRYHQRRAT